MRWISLMLHACLSVYGTGSISLHYSIRTEQAYVEGIRRFIRLRRKRRRDYSRDGFVWVCVTKY